MTDRPILFSAPMVRALLAGTKTQTRRVVKPAPGALDRPYRAPDGFWYVTDSQGGHLSTIGTREGRCPYGVPGDRLWVRETCRAEELSRPQTTRPATAKERAAYGRTTMIELDELDGADGVRYLADDHWRKIENTAEAGDRWSDLLHYDAKRRPSGSNVPGIHMPRWASRLTLKITDVRVERLNDISEADAEAEGAARLWTDGEGAFYEGDRGTYLMGYAGVWEHINGPGSWAANPWVWAVSFEVEP